MKKWYRVLNPFSDYQRGALICPEGLNRESLQVRGWITRHPVFVGPRKPTAEEIESWGNPAPEPEPAPAPAPEPIDDISDDEDDVLADAAVETAAVSPPQTAARRRGRPRRFSR